MRGAIPAHPIVGLITKVCHTSVVTLIPRICLQGEYRGHFRFTASYLDAKKSMLDFCQF
jgi:hypothetical protein